MTASAFSARHDRGDGRDLRELAFAGEPLASRLYFAIRDPWWRTVPLATTARRWRAHPDGFDLEVEASSRWASHPFEVVLGYRARGAELDCSFTGSAGAAFDYCRIGFCVLLPASSYAGRPGRSVSGSEETPFEFPEQIVTREQQDLATVSFHRPFARLSTSLASGTGLEWEFAGEEFEFEDQRNWTDASYKAYSVGEWPRRARAGERFAQSVRLRVEPAARVEPTGEPLVVRVGGPLGPLPPVGLYDGTPPGWLRPAGGFQEFNARRPAADVVGPRGVELAVNGAVHAADDDSVMETATVHGEIVRQARSLVPGIPLRLGPVSFLDEPGDWRDAAGAYAPQPPAPARSPRLEGDFGATWMLASVAGAAPAGADELRYFDAGLPAGPARSAVDRLAELRGRTLRQVEAPPPLRALAVETDEHVLLAVANTGPDLVRATVPDGRIVELAGFAHAWVPLDGPPGGGRHSARSSSGSSAS